MFNNTALNGDERNTGNNRGEKSQFAPVSVDGKEY